MKIYHNINEGFNFFNLLVKPNIMKILIMIIFNKKNNKFFNRYKYQIMKFKVFAIKMNLWKINLLLL